MGVKFAGDWCKHNGQQKGKNRSEEAGLRLHSFRDQDLLYITQGKIPLTFHPIAKQSHHTICWTRSRGDAHKQVISGEATSEPHSVAVSDTVCSTWIHKVPKFEWDKLVMTVADLLPFGHGYEKSLIISVSAIGSSQSLVIIFDWGKETTSMAILNFYYYDKKINKGEGKSKPPGALWALNLIFKY